MKIVRHSGIGPAGILLSLFLAMAPDASRAASYEPLDCSKAVSAADRTVCRNYRLGQDEAHMVTLFGILASLVGMGQRGDIIEAQGRWISTRESCGSNVGCLSRAYKMRINELSRSLDAVAKRGPF